MAVFFEHIKSLVSAGGSFVYPVIDFTKNATTTMTNYNTLRPGIIIQNVSGGTKTGGNLGNIVTTAGSAQTISTALTLTNGLTLSGGNLTVATGNLTLSAGKLIVTAGDIETTKLAGRNISDIFYNDTARAKYAQQTYNTLYFGGGKSFNGSSQTTVYAGDLGWQQKSWDIDESWTSGGPSSYYLGNAYTGHLIHYKIRTWCASYASFYEGVTYLSYDSDSKIIAIGAPASNYSTYNYFPYIVYKNATLYVYCSGPGATTSHTTRFEKIQIEILI